MHVRLSRIDGLTSAETETMIDGFLDGTYPRGDLPTMKGFIGYAAAVDRENGGVCAMSVWEHARALFDSRRAAAVARAERFEEVASDPLVDEYEIGLWRVGSSEAGSWIRVCQVAGLVEMRAKAMVDGFADNVRGIEKMPGYEGYLVAANYREGKVTSIGQWATLEDVKSSERAAAAARERQLQDVKPYREPLIDFYEIVTVQVAEERLARVA